jgi:hypothetical protein
MGKVEVKNCLSLLHFSFAFAKAFISLSYEICLCEEQETKKNKRDGKVRKAFFLSFWL